MGSEREREREREREGEEDLLERMIAHGLKERQVAQLRHEVHDCHSHSPTLGHNAGTVRQCNRTRHSSRRTSIKTAGSL